MKAILMTTALLVAGTSLSAQPCAESGPDSPGALHAEWIMEGWERREGAPEFVFAEKMDRYYDLENTGGVFDDNFAPGQTRLFRDASVCGANCADLQNSARSVLHGLTDADEALVGEEVASTTLGFVGQIDRLDGEVIAFDGQAASPGTLHQPVIDRSSPVERLRTLDQPGEGKLARPRGATRAHLPGTVAHYLEIIAQHPQYWSHPRGLRSLRSRSAAHVLRPHGEAGEAPASSYGSTL